MKDHSKHFKLKKFWSSSDTETYLLKKKKKQKHLTWTFCFHLLHSEIFEGYNDTEREHDKKNSQHSLSAQLDAFADMKFTYVISCQMYGAKKSSGDLRGQDILDLMIK